MHTTNLCEFVKNGSLDKFIRFYVCVLAILCIITYGTIKIYATVA